MNIKLLGYLAEIEWISPKRARPPLRPVDTIFVMFKFEEAVGSTLGFGISIEARDYSVHEFIDVVKVKGEEELGGIIRRDIEEKEKEFRSEERRKGLNKLTANLGGKVGVPFILEMR